MVNRAELEGERCADLQCGVTRRSFLTRSATLGLALATGPTVMFGHRALAGRGGNDLESQFARPPHAAKAWVFWWWLEGAASKAGITADFEALREQGIGGVLLVDAGYGGPQAPRGPAFMSAEWRENFRHALREATRCGIEMSVNLCSGWNASGPWVEREDALKTLVWTEVTIDGPQEFSGALARPQLESPERSADFLGTFAVRQNWYQDIAILACRESANGGWHRAGTLDLTASLEDERLTWRVPKGRWSVLRFGYVLAPHQDSSSRAIGWEIDPLKAEAMDRHFAATAAKLIEDAGELAGKGFNYTHIDSWEIGRPTWTAKFTEAFRERRGYDPLPYLPALAGKIVDGDQTSERFQWDFRRTIADLVAENYYGRLSQRSRERGLGTHAESGGPFFDHDIDALECLGTDDIPMGEFWTSPSRGRYEQGVSAPFFRSSNPAFPTLNFGTVRQAASAAHVYGKPLSQAEAHTSFLDDWTQDPFSLKADADRAFCLGLTRSVLSFYVHQQDLHAKPGNQWIHVGTHLDRNITWWDKSHAWFTYLARCQYLLRQGTFAADILYFCGEAIPNFALIDRKPLAGFDYDVINAQALLTRAEARDGRIMLPGGLEYRYLVLPEGAAEAISPKVLNKIRQLVEAGGTLVGPRPKRAPGLTDFARADEEVARLAVALWGNNAAPAGTRQVGKGRVIWGAPLSQIVERDQLAPDVELTGAPERAIDWIHRRSSAAEIYFIANGSDAAVNLEATFRIQDMQPELWDPVSGAVQPLAQFRQQGARTSVPLRFEPRQAWFVVFRNAVGGGTRTERKNFPALATVAVIEGSWQVSFDPDWGGPQQITFERLQDWTRRPEEGIRYYSGAVIYRKKFDAPGGVRKPLYLDLGQVKNLAQVRLNGHDLGVVWSAPWRVEIAEAIKEQGNELEIEVVNLWPNRLIGDGKLPQDRRLTRTNVRTYEPLVTDDFSSQICAVCAERKKTGAPPALLPSGLLGPVRLLGIQEGY